MTKDDIISGRNKIAKMLEDRKLFEAMHSLDALVRSSSSWELNRELDRLQVSYKYLLEYFSKGIDDPQRENIYSDIISALYALADKTAVDLLLDNNYEQFYSNLRDKNKLNMSLQKILSDYSRCISNLELSDDAKKSDAGSRMANYQLYEKEKIEKNFFINLWVSFPLSADDAIIIRQVFADSCYPDYFKELTVSALLLSSIQFYDSAKIEILLDNYMNGSINIALKALCSALFIMCLYKDRVALSDAISKKISILASNPKFPDDLKMIFMQFIRSRDTDKITKKVEEELIPNILKMYPDIFKKLKGDNSPLDISELESNPLWKDALDENGLTKKMEELNKIQMEGGDVFISTFSHLKKFPFFDDISNWFLPFHLDHSVLQDQYGDSANRLCEIIKEARFLCDSDKFSMCLSLASMPEMQRQMMVSQFNAQNADLLELKNSELPNPSEQREAIVANYMQNLYRFFKLYKHRDEFKDPFQAQLNLMQVGPIAPLLENEENLLLFGEFYLRHEHFDDAIQCFENLRRLNNDALPILLQKIGFCYQRLDNVSKAVEYYKRYDLFSSNDVWTLRHIASCYRSLGKRENALQYYLKAESLLPDNASLCITIGHCYFELNRIDDALKYYFKADYLEPTRHRAWRPIAWSSFMLRNFSQSEKYYIKILGDNPLSQDYLNIGHLWLAQHKIDKAIESYESCIRKEGKNMALFYDNFNADAQYLKSAGISSAEIHLVLDKVAFDMQ